MTNEPAAAVPRPGQAMGPWRRRGALLTLVLGLSTPRQALAQDAAPPAGDSARASAMFDEAMELAHKYRLAEACKLLEQSEVLDPSVITRFWLGRCQAVIGRLASALDAYGAVIADLEAQLARTDEASPEHERLRSGLAEVRAAADDIAPKVPRLALHLHERTAALPGLVVKHNGEPLDPARWATPRPVNLGDHALEVRAPGHVPFAQTVQLKEYGQVLEVPVHLQEEKTRVEQVVVTVGEPIGPLPIVTGVLGAVGVAGITAGIAVGFSARSRYDDALANCTPQFCTDAAVEEQQNARTQGDIATGLVIGGIAVTAAAGATLIAALLGDDDEEQRKEPKPVTVGLSAAGASLEVVW